MKLSTIATLFTVALLAAACHRMQDIGGADAGSDADTDADTDADSDADSDGDYDVFGYVGMAQRTTDAEEGGFLTLTAAVYGEPYDASADSWVEARTTPDGVTCDIYYHTGFPPDPEDPPPDQLDGGAFRVGDGDAWPDVLEVEFDGEVYTADHRTQWDADNPMPSWLVPGEFQVALAADAAGAVPGFEVPLEISPVPEMFEESPQPVDGDGNYLFEWSDNGAVAVELALNFNMDWDDSAIVCQPESGAEEILIPQAWIEEYSWGSGEALLYSRDAVAVDIGDARVEMRVTRGHSTPFVSAND
jgi:hypothetical protein